MDKVQYHFSPPPALPRYCCQVSPIVCLPSVDVDVILMTYSRPGRHIGSRNPRGGIWAGCIGDGYRVARMRNVSSVYALVLIWVPPAVHPSANTYQKNQKWEEQAWSVLTNSTPTSEHIQDPHMESSRKRKSTMPLHCSQRRKTRIVLLRAEASAKVNFAERNGVRAFEGHL